MPSLNSRLGMWVNYHSKYEITSLANKCDTCLWCRCNMNVFGEEIVLVKERLKVEVF